MTSIPGGGSKNANELDSKARPLIENFDDENLLGSGPQSLNNTASSLTLPPSSNNGSPSASARKMRKSRVSFKYAETPTAIKDLANSSSHHHPLTKPSSASSNNNNNNNNNNDNSGTNSRGGSSGENSRANSLTEHPFRNNSFSASPIRTRDEILKAGQKDKKQKKCGCLPPKLRTNIKNTWKWLKTLNYVAVLLTFSACSSLLSAVLLFIIGPEIQLETDLTVIATTTTMNVSYNPNYNSSDSSSEEFNSTVLFRNTSTMFFRDIRVDYDASKCMNEKQRQSIMNNQSSVDSNNEQSGGDSNSALENAEISFILQNGLHSSPMPVVVSQHGTYNITRSTNFSSYSMSTRPANVIGFKDALFVAVSGYTATGLSTVDYSHWNGPTMSVVGGIITLGSIVLLTTLPAVLRYFALIQERKKLIQILLSTGAYDDDDNHHHSGGDDDDDNNDDDNNNNNNYNINAEEILSDTNNNNGYRSPKFEENNLESMLGEKRNSNDLVQNQFISADNNINNSKDDAPLLGNSNNSSSLKLSPKSKEKQLKKAQFVFDDDNFDDVDESGSPTYSVTSEQEKQIGLVFVDSTGETMRIPYPKNDIKSENNNNKSNFTIDDDDDNNDQNAPSEIKTTNSDENLDLLGIQRMNSKNQHEAATTAGSPPSNNQVIKNNPNNTTSRHDKSGSNENSFRLSSTDFATTQHQHQQQQQLALPSAGNSLSSPPMKTSPQLSQNSSLARSTSPSSPSRANNNLTVSPNTRTWSPTTGELQKQSSATMNSSSSSSAAPNNNPRSPNTNNNNNNGDGSNSKSATEAKKKSDRQRANTILGFGALQPGANSNGNLNGGGVSSPKDTANNMNASFGRNNTNYNYNSSSNNLKSPPKTRKNSGSPKVTAYNPADSLTHNETMPFISLTGGSESPVKPLSPSTISLSTTQHQQQQKNGNGNNNGGSNFTSSPTTSPTHPNANYFNNGNNNNNLKIPLSSDLQKEEESHETSLLFAPPAASSSDENNNSSGNNSSEREGGARNNNNSSSNVKNNNNNNNNYSTDKNNNNNNSVTKKEDNNKDDDKKEDTSDDIPEASSITFGQRIVYEDGLAHVNQQIDICLIIFFGAFFYWFVVHMFFTVCVWAAGPSDSWTFGNSLFHIISAFNNAGFAKPYITEVTGSPFLMICFMIVMVIGNALFPIMFRLMLEAFHWLMKKYTEEKKVVSTDGGATSSPLLLTEQQEREREKSQLRKAKFIFGQPIQVWQHSLWLFLRYPRRYYTHMFNNRASFMLLGVWSVMTIIGGLLMIPEMIKDDAIPPIEGATNHKFLIALFQTISVRTTGFAVVNVDRLTIGHLTWWVLAMYISAYPFILTVRSSSGRRSEVPTDAEQNEKKQDEKAETTTSTKSKDKTDSPDKKKTTGDNDDNSPSSSTNGDNKKKKKRRSSVTDDEEDSENDDDNDSDSYDDEDIQNDLFGSSTDSDSDDDEYFKRTTGVASSVVRDEATNVMARDLFWLYLATIIIAYSEMASTTLTTSNTLDYSIYLRIIFEVVSSFANVGLSLPIPNAVPNGSFSASLKSTLSPLVLIIVMYFGKHRNLPQTVDEAIAIHVRKYEFEGELNPDEDVRGINNNNDPDSEAGQEMQSMETSMMRRASTDAEGVHSSSRHHHHPLGQRITKTFNYQASFAFPRCGSKATGSGTLIDDNNDDNNTDQHQHHLVSSDDALFGARFEESYCGEEMFGDEEMSEAHRKKLLARAQKIAIASERRREEYKKRIVAFYEHYNPVRLLQVDRIISAFEQNPKSLLRNLEITYGPFDWKKKFFNKQRQMQKQQEREASNNTSGEHHHHGHHHNSNKHHHHHGHGDHHHGKKLRRKSSLTGGHSQSSFLTSPGSMRRKPSLAPSSSLGGNSSRKPSSASFMKDVSEYM